MSANAPAIPQCLYTNVCPHCGYSLAGLPHVGRCPECGSYFDQSEIILYGWARGSHETLVNTKGSRIILPAMVFVFASFGAFFWPLFLTSGGFRYWPLPFLAFVLALLSYALIKRQDIRHPGSIQVRLNELGCIQYDNLTGPSAIGEFRNSYGWLVLVLGALTLLFLRIRGVIKGELFWFLLVYLCALTPWRTLWRRIRPLKRRANVSVVGNPRLAHKGQTPWKKVSHVLFRKLNAGNYRLRIDRGFWGFSNFPVDAEIRCTDEQSANLKELVEHWLAMVPGKTVTIEG